MSLRTFKARPKPNLDLTNKRRALTDEKSNEEIKNKTESSNEGSEREMATSSAADSTANRTDNDQRSSESTSSLSPSQNEQVTTSSSRSTSITMTKLKPRPRPNLAPGGPSCRANVTIATSSQKNTTNTQQDTEDCLIVGVSYPSKASQENKISSSNNASVPLETASSDTQQQRNIGAKLKARPKPNLISLNRNKRALPPDSTTPQQNAQDPTNKSSADLSKDLANSTVKDNHLEPATSTSEHSPVESEELKKIVPTEQDNATTNNINKLGAKQENKARIKRKKPVKKSKRKQTLFNAKLLFLRRKLRSLMRALGYLKKIIAKKKKQMASKKAVNNCIKFRRKIVFIKKKVKRLVKILKMTKQKLKRFANSRQLKDGKVYSVLWRIVIKEIEKEKSKIKSYVEVHKNEISSKDNKEEISLQNQKEKEIEINRSRVNAVDCKEREDVGLIKATNNDQDTNELKENNAADLKDKTDIVSAEKKKKVHKIRCKINPMITKPSGAKSMRIKLFKDDGTCVNNLSSDMCSDKDNASSQSSKENSLKSSPGQDIKSPTQNHTRRFNMNTVKPNLAKANRNYKPIQYTTSYGKLNNTVKQKFKDKFGNKIPPEHSKLTMLDLIFYNPSTNPMSDKEKKKDLSNETEITNGESKQSVQTEEKPVNEEEKEPRAETNEENDEDESASRAVDTNGLPVPQLKITADGKVIIAPESLIVPGKNDDAIKNESRPLIVENDLTHHKVSNKKANLEKKTWSFQETLKFYKVLNETGSDFLSMASHFPDRTRNCLKRKFKREEKINAQLIDKVIGSRRIDFSHVEKELALNQMWDEVEKCCKRRSKYMVDIPDLNKGNISEMFLTKKEREMKSSNSDDTNGANNTVIKECNTTNKQIKNRKPSKKKKKPKVLRLKEYLAGNGNNGNTKKTLKINLKCLEEPESANVSSDEDETLKPDTTGIPIVVNTSIESSGIKYTKSVTFNPGNMDLPVDINETIAHTSDQECPSSTEIIREIVDILSTDEKPSILSTEDNHSTPTEDLSECD